MRPPCGLWDPYKKMGTVGFLSCYWHARPPLLFGERAGVRGNMRLRWRFRQKNGPGRLPLLLLARSAPSPLWGKGWGEGEHATSLWAEGSLQKNGHGRLPPLLLARPAPSPLWGEGWGEGEHATQVAVPSKKWARSASSPDISTVGPPLLFGERVGVRGNMRPPCGLRDPYKNIGTAGPLSPLWRGLG